MNLYSDVVSLGDDAQDYLKSLEPKPINDEEDSGSMAQFMLHVSGPNESTDSAKTSE
jgi:hypothetical protein